MSELEKNIDAIMQTTNKGMSANEMVLELEFRNQMPEFHTVIDIADLMKEMYGDPINKDDLDPKLMTGN